MEEFKCIVECTVCFTNLSTNHLLVEKYKNVLFHCRSFISKFNSLPAKLIIEKTDLPLPTAKFILTHIAIRD